MEHPGVTRRAWVQQIMGMPVSVHVRGTATDPERTRAVAAVYADLHEVDRVFSPFRPDSEIARLRAGTADQAHVGPDVRAVLELCAQAARVTGGYFSAWLPDTAGAVILDPSGLVKGWAVERATRHLAELVDDDYYLSAGGDVALKVREGVPERPPWRVAVEDPHRRGERVAVLELSGGAVATSGTAHRGAHIVDPLTGQPATALASVTVVGPSMMWADVFATAACARGIDALAWLDWPEGYHALAVTADGRLIRTDGMAALINAGQAGRRKQTSVDQRAKPSRS